MPDYTIRCETIKSELQEYNAPLNNLLIELMDMLIYQLNQGNPLTAIQLSTIHYLEELHDIPRA